MFKFLRASLGLVGSLLVLVLTVGAAEREQKAVTDESQTDADFAVQGEYVGETLRDGQPTRLGAHVIALGGGKFHAVGYWGGLPGAGWDRNERPEVDGATRDGQTVFVADGGRAVIENGLLTIFGEDGQKQGELKRVVRKSTTLGAKPPQGAVVLFDGSSADAWDGGRVTADGLLMAGATSNQKFQDLRVHMEFRTPYKPYARGQGRGNSGLYLLNKYEIQLLDSFGLEGRDNECGGIYSIRAPDVNMCFPPLSWQTYDIEFTAARFDDRGNKVKNALVTVRHNGVLIHDRVELPRGTPPDPEQERATGPLYLQDHDNPVHFRNIWVLEKK